MICPECGRNNADDAAFCGQCGSPLAAGAGSEGVAGAGFGSATTTGPGSATTTGSGGVTAAGSGGGQPQPHRRTPRIALVACVLAAAVVGVGALVWALVLRPKPEPLPRKEGTALFCDESQIAVGKDTTLHLRVRIPSDALGVDIRDTSNNKVLASFDAADMEDAGDGYLWANAQVNVAKSDPGVVRYVAEVKQGEDSEPNNNNPELPVPVIRDDVKPVPDSSDWVLADACDWVDQNLAGQEGEEAAQALAKHLAADDRVASVKSYGTAVMFTVANTGSLYCVSLEAASPGMLGAEDDHTFVQDGPALQAFSAYESKKNIDSGQGITAGNTITSAKVLLLNPTPSLMEDASSSEVEQACAEYAQSLGEDAPSLKQGDEALRSLLAGDAYGAGLLVLRAHGIAVRGSGTSLFQMRAQRKDANVSWEEVRNDLSNYIEGLADTSVQSAGGLFFGLVDDPSVWRCAITARATDSPGSWDIGISAAPFLISNQYSSRPLDECIVWLSVCNGLENKDFATWASTGAHGVQLLAGYEGSVSQEEDARQLSQMLQGLVTNADEPWRCMNATESLDNMQTTVRAERAGVVLQGNLGVFSKGLGTVSGSVVSKDGKGVANASVEAWRYFGGTFVSQGDTTTNSDGSFELAGLPSGRYVLVVESQSERALATIVLDEEAVSGGTIELGIGVPETDDQEPESTEAMIGTANTAVTADDEFYYMGIGTNYQENGAQAKPKIVRINRSNVAQCEILWEGATGGGAAMLRLVGDTIVAASSPWSGDISIMTMKTDGSEYVVVVPSNKIGKYYSNQIFVCSDDHIFYGSVSGSNWRIKSCALDGSDDKLLCEGTTSQSSVSISVLTVSDGKVFFLVPGSGSSNTKLLCSVPTKGGSYTEVMTLDSIDKAQVLGNRIYSVENNEFVSYSLDGSERTPVAAMPSSVKSGYIWNICERYAFVFGSADSYEESGVWRIGVQDGSAARVADYEQFANLNIVDDVVIETYISDEADLFNLDLVRQAELWPNANASRLASTASGGSDAESEPIDAAALIESQSGEAVNWSNTADYDDDGTEETFAMVGGEFFGTAYSNNGDVWTKPNLWFCSSSGDVAFVCSFDKITYVNGVFADPAGSGYRFASIELTAGGSGSSSRVFGVQNGNAKELSVSGRDVQERDGRIIVGKSYFADGGGHRIDWRELTFDPGSFTLNEGPSVGDTSLGELP